MSIRALTELPAAPRRARVPLGRTGPLESTLGAIARRLYGGKVPDPLRAAFHHRRVLAGWLGLESAAMTWKRLPPRLHALAVLAVSQEIGCSWCIDFGEWEFRHRGIDPRAVREIDRWTTSDAYSDLDRAVLRYAVAASATPSAATDAMVEDLRPALDDRQIVELAALVALENYRSRFNAGLGLRSQGYRDDCAVPEVV